MSVTSKEERACLDAIKTKAQDLLKGVKGVTVTEMCYLSMATITTSPSMILVESVPTVLVGPRPKRLWVVKEMSAEAKRDCSEENKKMMREWDQKGQAASVVAIMEARRVLYRRMKYKPIVDCGWHKLVLS